MIGQPTISMPKFRSLVILLDVYKRQVLEMAKERVVNVRQKVTYGNIEIESGERINEGDVRYEQ